MKDSRLPLARPPRFYIPETFDAAQVLPIELLKYGDCANYLIHLIVRGRTFWLADEHGFVPLKVEFLRNVIPSRVERPLRESLLTRDVIETDNHYIRRVKAMGYRLADAYRHERVRPVACSDKRLSMKIAAIRDAEFRTDLHHPVHRHLYSWLSRVSIDRERAEQIILSTPDLLRHADIHFTAVAMIADGAFDFCYDRVGRVHHNITRLARELRPSLAVGVEPLVNVDIANSQPLVLGLLMLQHRAGGGRLSARKFPAPVRNPYAKLVNVSRDVIVGYGRLPIIIGSGVGGVELAPDERLYLDLCERGRIYEHLARATTLRGADRDEVKTKFYREVFFGRNGHVTDFTKLFEREFPSVMRLIRTLKCRDHRDLACAMQNVEASIVINGVCRRLAERHPHVPVVTIHDSAMTTPAHADLVAEVMRDCFEEVGLVPTLKVEREDAAPAILRKLGAA